MTVVTGGGPLVVGLGSADSGDDAVGLAVARAVEDRLPELAVVEHEDPTGLLDLWAGHDPVVVIDAARSGAVSGFVHWLETGQAWPPVGPREWAHDAGHGSTHAVGLADMVELGRVLGRLPARLVVVGVEAESFDQGAPLSPEVAAAVPVAAERVCAAVAAAVGEGAVREGTGDVPG